MTIFTVSKKEKQVSFNQHLPNPMRFFSIVTFLLLTCLSASGQQAEQIKLKDLQQLINTSSEKVQVINFWATWCAPCVKEVPFFETLNRENKSVDVTLVSMDYDLDPNPEKVYRFITRKKLQSKVVILAERNPNDWIDKIDKSWSGALPATLIVNTKTGKRKFVQKELHEGELEKLIEEIGN
jgi:thiol-disulfide isomerase/thioredoxin